MKRDFLFMAKYGPKEHIDTIIDRYKALKTPTRMLSGEERTEAFDLTTALMHAQKNNPAATQDQKDRINKALWGKLAE